MQEDVWGRQEAVVRMEAVRIPSVALRDKKRAPTSLTTAFAEPAFAASVPGDPEGTDYTITDSSCPEGRYQLVSRG